MIENVGYAVYLCESIRMRVEEYDSAANKTIIPHAVPYVYLAN